MNIELFSLTIMGAILFFTTVITIDTILNYINDKIDELIKR